MTIERAIEILNPEHREHYASIDPVNEACRMGMAALCRERDREKGCGWCEGFCPDVAGDLHCDYCFCPMCGREL